MFFVVKITINNTIILFMKKIGINTIMIATIISTLSMIVARISIMLITIYRTIGNKHSLRKNNKMRQKERKNHQSSELILY